jgi:hypothetical protein
VVYYGTAELGPAKRWQFAAAQIAYGFGRRF